MNDCGCIERNQPIEFPISEQVNVITNTPFILEIPYSDYSCQLKEKIICNFNDILSELECGILPDLSFLLEEISSLDVDTWQSQISKIDPKNIVYHDHCSKEEDDGGDGEHTKCIDVYVIEPEETLVMKTLI